MGTPLTEVWVLAATLPTGVPSRCCGVQVAVSALNLGILIAGVATNEMIWGEDVYNTDNSFRVGLWTAKFGGTTVKVCDEWPVS